MSKITKFLLVGPNKSLLLREKFRQALYEEQFIEEIDDQTIVIKELKNEGKPNQLQKVTIENLDYKTGECTVKKIWRVNLEKDILGISLENPSNTPSKTECAILVLQEVNSDSQSKRYILSILLVEMTNDLKTKTKTTIEKKFITSMNRLYLLLSLNDHFNKNKGYEDDLIEIEFRGIIIYNKPKESDPNYATQLNLIFQNLSNKKMLTISTILNDRDKITIKPFPKKSQDSDEERVISLKDLLN